MDPTPRHRMDPYSVADPKTGRVCADVTARESRHSQNKYREYAEERQPLGQREQRPNLRRQQEPTDRGQDAESDGCDDHDHPDPMRSRDIDAVVQTLVSHSSRR